MIDNDVSHHMIIGNNFFVNRSLLQIDPANK